jgi:DNA-binding NarL/FixJ family response regulator
MSAPIPTVRIIVADDQQTARAGLAALLDTQPDFTVVGTASDGAEAVQLGHALRPDVVLMDIRMPNMDGIEATKRLAGSEHGPLVLGAPPQHGDAQPSRWLRAPREHSHAEGLGPTR